MTAVRRATRADSTRIWALNNLPNLGLTSDPSIPLDLEPPARPPSAFPDLENVEQSFVAIGGDFFIVADDQEHVLGMGGFKPAPPDAVEVLRVRVHPATRRRGIGRMLMDRIEERAFELGYQKVTLDTATNQPEAVAFYEGLGYREVRRETRPEWSWTLAYFEKELRSWGEPMAASEVGWHPRCPSLPAILGSDALNLPGRGMRHQPHPSTRA